LTITWNFLPVCPVYTGGNLGSEVGILHCLGILGTYLYLRFYSRFFRCWSWFYVPHLDLI